MAGYQTEMLHHFQELLKIPSVRGEGIPGAPFGRKNREALDYVLRLSEQFGLTTVNLDGYLGYSEYGSGEEYVCSISHLDVVPPGEGWKHPPFGAWEENGVIYARGAGDNKPGSIAGLYALRCMKELGYEPKHKVRVIYGCAEETGMEDLEYYWKSQPLPIFGFTPDSDGYDIINAEKGCALPGFVDSKNEEKTERNAGYLVVSHSGGGMLRQGTRKGIRRTPANRGMRAHWVVKGLDISEDVCHGMCP